MYIPKGVDLHKLDHDKEWEFEPVKTWKVGQKVTGGNIIGTVYENALFNSHKIMIPPKFQGRISRIYEPGYYTLDDTVMEIENMRGGTKKPI